MAEELRQVKENQAGLTVEAASATLIVTGVDDCGNMINPLIVAGQIHGGIAQGVGQAMIAEAVYDEDGQLITGSFMDYAMPRARDFPRFELDHTVTPSPLNPMGAKGIGEAGTVPVAGAVISAIEHALEPFGVRIAEAPISPGRLIELIAAGKQGS